MRNEYLIMLIAWLAVGTWVALVILANRKQHPKVLFFLFMVELWERFSYYGMRALLVLYLTGLTLTGGCNISKGEAYGIYAAYGALVYLTPLAGGWAADRILGFRKSILWGAILMAAGQFTLATSAGEQRVTPEGSMAVAAVTGTAILAGTADGHANMYLMYLGLALLVIGNGFFKPNISSLIGRFYAPGDPRRDGAFTIFYMGINIGAFLTPLTCGTIGELEGWSYGFLCAGLGMCLGLGIFLYTAAKGYLGPYAEPPDSPARQMAEQQQSNPDGREQGADPAASPSAEAATVAEPPANGPQRPPYLSPTFVYLATLAFLPVGMLLIRFNDLMDFLLLSAGTAAIAYMIYLSLQYGQVERERLWAIIVLLVFTAVFWTFFELAGSAVNIFTRDNVDKNLFGLQLTTSNFQAVNPLFIMLFAPLFSVMWVWLARRGWEPAAPLKFAIGLALLGGGFVFLNLGRAAAVDALVPAYFLVIMYLLHTLGELALSPVGLSLVTKLAPERVAGFVMGFWFLSSAIAHQAGKWIARWTEVEEGAGREASLTQSLNVFTSVGVFALVAAGVLLVLAPTIKRWMHGVR